MLVFRPQLVLLLKINISLKYFDWPLHNVNNRQIYTAIKETVCEQYNMCVTESFVHL